VKTTKNKQQSQDDRYTCPDCGVRSMIKVENKIKGTYVLKCENCKGEIGPLPIHGIKDYV
jgi:transcription elongation factor Elf1